jgi:hypothetical protein
MGLSIRTSVEVLLVTVCFNYQGFNKADFQGNAMDYNVPGRSLIRGIGF